MTLERDDAVAELAELRRRAYGPDGDIAADPAAQARLAQLERGVRGAAVESFVDGSAAADQAPADAARSEPGGAAPPNDAAPHATAAEASRDPDRRSRFGTLLPWLIAAVSAIVAIVTLTAFVASELSRPQPELSLGATVTPPGVERPALDTPMLDYWGLSTSALEYHGAVGRIDVWTMEGEEDVACIFFSVGGEFWGQNCAVRPLAPLVEFRTSEDIIPSDSLTPAVPPGSFIRFAWEGDVVNVYLVRSDALARAQSSTLRVISADPEP